MMIEGKDRCVATACGGSWADCDFLTTPGGIGHIIFFRTFDAVFEIIGFRPMMRFSHTHEKIDTWCSIPTFRRW